MKSRLFITFTLILSVSSALGYEYNVQRFNETLISFNHAVLGGNCTPNSYGSVHSISGPHSTSQGFFMKLVPTGKKGRIYCSFKLSNKELITVKFNLGDYVKTPLVDIIRKNKKSKFNKALDYFVDYTRGKIVGLEEVESSDLDDVVNTKSNSYKLKKLHISPDGLFFVKYKLDKAITDKHFRLKNIKADTIQFSSLLNKGSNTYLYMSTKDLSAIRRALP